MFPEPRRRTVRLVLTDGRRLEGELVRWRGAHFVGPALFEADDIASMEDIA
jgi:hypothetical protein